MKSKLTLRDAIKRPASKLRTALRWLLVGAVVFLISMLFPNQVQFPYSYSQGDEWGYNRLTADFDFPVLKSPAEREADRKDVERQIRPIYVLDRNVRDKQLRELDAQFESMLSAANQAADLQLNKQVYKIAATTILKSLYSKKIINLEAKHSDLSVGVVTLTDGNSRSDESVSNMLTPQRALDYVDDALIKSKLAEAEFLIEPLHRSIQPNVVFGDSLTQVAIETALASISTTKGAVQRGATIVDKGDLIDDRTYWKLESYRERYESDITGDRSSWLVFLGYFLLTSLIIGALMMFLRLRALSVYGSFRQLSFILLLVAAYSWLTYIFDQTSVLSVYAIPYCIVPILMSNFFRTRLALFVHLIVVLIASFLSSTGYEFAFIQILAGMAAVLSNVKTRYWGEFFLGIGGIFITYVLGFLGLTLISEGGMSLEAESLSTYGWLAINAFLTILAYPLIPLLERIFGFVSDIRLAELADLDRPLLKKLSIEAPGTFQHSLQVANLSEAAAKEIGANGLLLKTAALYHDIGKMKRPEMFIENQSGRNPHDDLSPLESAQVIIEHVTEGEIMARKARLPNLLVEFILTHHGTSRVEYFYRQYSNQNPDIKIDETQFTYPGPLPKSKEQTILMMADSIEAAAKSLKNPTGVEIDTLVDKIIEHKIHLKQLDRSPLTFRELQAVQAVFKKLLRSIHHVRVEYPELNKEE